MTTTAAPRTALSRSGRVEMWDGARGRIVSLDGHLYHFTLADWRAGMRPETGQTVTFTPVASVRNRAARDVHPGPRPQAEE